MSVLWTSAEAAAATGGEAIAPWEATGVSIDTRTLQPGDLFIALKAARDGHDFVAQALEKGACGALVQYWPKGVAPDAPMLLVDDVQSALEALGRAARRRFTGRVVAVTGSVGKTSTKEMLRTVLSGQGTVHAAEASYNNHWGVPLTLARMPADRDFAVIEIGMNAPGEIAPLARLARPHVAMVTTVAPAHLAAFDSVAGIAAEKASIFEGLLPGGAAVFSADIETAPIVQAAAEAHAKRVISFGESGEAHHRLTDVTLHDSCTVAQGRAWRSPVLFKVHAPGRHFAVNAMGVLAVGTALGLDRSMIANDLARWSPGAGRGAREVIGLDPVDASARVELIDDAYNANPASMAASLEVLAAATVQNDVGRISTGRRVAYLGDMKELGPTGADLHAALAQHKAMTALARVHCVGPLMRALWEALPQDKRGRWTETAAEMADGVARDLDAGDVVLVKGSLSMGLARVVDAIRRMGDGRAQAALNEDSQ